jgi:hypothetical protein
VDQARTVASMRHGISAEEELDDNPHVDRDEYELQSGLGTSAKEESTTKKLPNAKPAG